MTDEYSERLLSKFGDLKIEIVNFDSGATPESMAAYVLVSGLTKQMLKDKGSTALDLGNYIYRRFGIVYEMCPEFHRKDEPKNSVAFYISKKRFDKMDNLKTWLIDVYNQKADSSDKVKRAESALYYGRRFLVPNQKEDRTTDEAS